MKKESFLKRNWKNIVIIMLALILMGTIYQYNQLVQEHNSQIQEIQKLWSEYQLELSNYLSDLELNITKEFGKIDSNYDCFERGTVECYEKGTVICYEK